MTDDEMLAAWKSGASPRPHLRPDGVPTRIDRNFMSAAELAIQDAVEVIEATGGSPALTDAVRLLAEARDRVADHIEGRYAAKPAPVAVSATTPRDQLSARILTCVTDSAAQVDRARPLDGSGGAAALAWSSPGEAWWESYTDTLEQQLDDLLEGDDAPSGRLPAGESEGASKDPTP